MLGPDRAKIGIQRLPDSSVQQVLQYDEITSFVDARYISAPEAVWRISQFKLQDKSHVVVSLPVHLPGEQSVMFAENEEEEALNKAAGKHTRLTAFFELAAVDSEARDLYYHDVPQHYKWNAQKTRWEKRERKAIGDKTIGRMYSVSPSDSERFHLRLLLLNVRGPQSFDELRTVGSESCATFKEAAFRRELLLDDAEYRYCLEEAASWQMPVQLRQLFAVILVFGTPQNPLDLWTSFIKDLRERNIEESTADLLCHDQVNTSLFKYCY